MAQFMDVHSGFVGVTAEQLHAAHEADLAIEHEEGVHFERAWLTRAGGPVAWGPARQGDNGVGEWLVRSLAAPSRHVVVLQAREAPLWIHFPAYHPAGRGWSRGYAAIRW